MCVCVMNCIVERAQHKLPDHQKVEIVPVTRTGRGSGLRESVVIVDVLLEH